MEPKLLAAIHWSCVLDLRFHDNLYIFIAKIDAIEGCCELFTFFQNHHVLLIQKIEVSVVLKDSAAC